MSKVAYTERQVEVANLLRSVGGDGVPNDVVAEIVDMFGEDKRPVEAPSNNDALQTDALIRLKILEESDWRKKAALTALLISRSLE